MPHHLKNTKGFTLIELLVVTAIIGILASIAIALLNPATLFGQARDTRRKADLKEYAKALQLYYNDNKQFPDSGTTTPTLTWVVDIKTWFGVGGLGPDLVPSYMKSAPPDPTNTGNYKYGYTDGGTVGGCTDNQSFVLRALLERGISDPQAHRGGTASTYTYLCDGTTSVGSTIVGGPDDGYYYITSN